MGDVSGSIIIGVNEVGSMSFDVHSQRRSKELGGYSDCLMVEMMRTGKNGMRFNRWIEWFDKGKS